MFPLREQAAPDRQATTALRTSEAGGPRSRYFSGICHGTLGELWQGPVRHRGRDEIGIVTLPIPLYSRATYVTSPVPAVSEAPTPKRAAAIREFQRKYQVTLPPGRWMFDSQLQTSKGMASSTADIVATVRCLFNLHAIEYDETALRGILRGIERSDPVFLDEHALYLSGKQEIVRTFPAALAFTVCYVVLDAQVDTEVFTSAKLGRSYQRNRREYERSLSSVLSALETGDHRAVAAQATRSAALAQAYLHHPIIDELIENRRGLSALGVTRAHTGAIAALLYPAEVERSRMEQACAFFHERKLSCAFTRGGLPLV
ncbi:hypothetical protein [Amycolatopsis minnesotensis]|uniref:GHMP family kinase ATP-binding protein n=1 Tax=Amycolatopsis minnesotensis TaxID=337894 RepID=UPI0031D2DC2E